MHEQDMLSALNAITEARRITFVPILFQAALYLRNTGILDCLDQQGKQGTPLSAITERTVLSEYAVSVLPDMSLNGRTIICKEGICYLTKIGHYLLHNTMTCVDTDSAQDVCYQGLFFLVDSLSEGKPSGLKIFGNWPTMYPAFSQLPGVACDSWLAFDHYYSGGAFNVALPYVFVDNPTTLYNVGGNAGRWVLHYCELNESIAVTLLDLSQQIVLAKEDITDAGFFDRIDFHAVDVLSDTSLPDEADTWWVSQFLDYFSPEQIISILSKITSVMKPDAKLCIMELFWDAQRFEATSLSPDASPLYFICMTNGNNHFYSAERFCNYLDKAGFQVARRHDNLDVGHTLLIC